MWNIVRQFFVVPVLVLVVAFPFSTSAQSRCVAPRTPDIVYSSSNKIITFYVPHESPGCLTSMEGCNATSCIGLKDNLRKPTCLDAVRLGQAKYVTLASDWSNQGKYFNIGTVTYLSAFDKQMHTVQNVVGYVHDWGSAFNGRPDKLDVCTTVCANCTDAQASALAQGKNVSLARSSLGAADLNIYSNPGNPYSPVRVSPFSAYGATAPQQPATAQPGASQGATSPLAVSPTPVSELLNRSNTSSSNSSTIFPTGRSAGTIFAQPNTAARGSNVLVSWTSVNMKSSSCKVLANNANFADGQEGSKRLTIPDSASDEFYFLLECTTAAGEIHRASYSITIR